MVNIMDSRTVSWGICYFLYLCRTAHFYPVQLVQGRDETVGWTCTVTSYYGKKIITSGSTSAVLSVSVFIRLVFFTCKSANHASHRRGEERWLSERFAISKVNSPIVTAHQSQIRRWQHTSPPYGQPRQSWLLSKYSIPGASSLTGPLHSQKSPLENSQSASGRLVDMLSTPFWKPG